MLVAFEKEWSLGVFIHREFNSLRNALCYDQENTFMYFLFN